MTAGTEGKQRTGKINKNAEELVKKETVQEAEAGKTKKEIILGKGEHVECEIVSIGSELPTYLL